MHFIQVVEKEKKIDIISSFKRTHANPWMNILTG